MPTVNEPGRQRQLPGRDPEAGGQVSAPTLHQPCPAEGADGGEGATKRERGSEGGHLRWNARRVEKFPPGRRQAPFAVRSAFTTRETRLTAFSPDAAGGPRHA